MKNANAMVVLIAMMVFSAQAMANYSTLVEKTARAVEGSSDLAAEIQSCKYSVMAGSNLDGVEEVVLFLNSDEAAGANASIRLSPDQVPLKEGVILSKPSLEIRYQDGVLTQMTKTTTEGPFVRDYKVTKLAVSADLKQIASGYTKNATASLIREKALFEMNCKF